MLMSEHPATGRVSGNCGLDPDAKATFGYLKSAALARVDEQLLILAEARPRHGTREVTNVDGSSSKSRFAVRRSGAQGSRYG